MTSSFPCGVLAAIARHFDDPRVREATQLTVLPRGDDARPVRLSPMEARRAVDEPAADPELAAAVWQSALAGARAETTPRGPAQLLLIWLLLPRLSGTARKICNRLRADRADVESEMMLALLEEVPCMDLPGELAAQALVRAARSAGWRYARAVRREMPADWLDREADSAGNVFEDATAEEAERQAEFDVAIPRPAGPYGLRAQLRVSGPVGKVEAAVLTGLADDYGVREVVRRAGRSKRRRRVGTLKLRLGGRRR
ncbi:hypothetical protein [Actinacidiphila guanduensis]|uniref:Uncharacterized protein n=1 Tax=Actinacidiphila guanduensis TaxID=310781 RepID=A0A1H0DF36_9ACTN|nr:hypothetical protein [Actinacidiphila guanduensis]SDN68626.1 hypothetical protein SAMN05216259_105191 [Actinacidiphila guanduensis]